MTLTPARPGAAPLNALRALEAAARHGSFLRAAEELNVTPGAVAQQIKKLEAWAGADLFERHTQGVAPTELARRLLPDLEVAFAALGTASQTLRHAGARAEIRIAALPAIAQLWLSPRLSDLKMRVPGAEIAIHALDSPPMLDRGAYDLALYPADCLAGVRQQIVAQSALIPVAAPGVAARIDDLRDLENAVLIHDLAWRGDWTTWLVAQGMAHGTVQRMAERGPTHSLYSIAVERCVAGDGVLIGHTALVEQHLDSGALRRVFTGRDLPWHPLCLVSASGGAGNARLDAVASALVSESWGDDG